MRVLLLDAPGPWADAVAALPASGPLPTRTVLVPSERHAHALRRALLRAGHASTLAGTRFVGPLTAATEVLRNGGVSFSPDEEGLRPARLLALFREDLPLKHFDLELLRTTRGWEDAFAGAIADVEAAGLAPGDLPTDTAHARDLAFLWSRVATEAGDSWSASRVYLRAAELLASDARAWPFDGPALALATGHEHAVLARFVTAIPGVAIAFPRVRPVPERFVERVRKLFGPDAARALAAAAGERPSPGDTPTERDLLASYLLADSKALASANRPRSKGPDGTVDLEEHAGVEGELEATATWVARQVLEAKRALEDVAVLFPAEDPLAQLVAERLERLPFEGGPLPVYVAGGVPAVAEAGGARILAVVRALASYLSAETVAAVLPALRLDGDEARTHLTHGEAMELAYSLGTVGGNAAHPEGAIEWSGRAAARVAELEAALAHARADEDSASRESWRLERTLRSLRAARPALDALVGVARAVVGRATLAALWEALSAFLESFLLLPGEGGAVRARLVESLAPACGSAVGRSVLGHDALDVIESHLLALRVPRGRFGEPAVYVGTVQGAAGLDFAAVRVIGLCEGVLPSQPREDPVLPERLRDALEQAVPGRVLPHRDDRVTAQVHALFGVVRGAREAIALSAPRVDLARTEREPASLFIDAAAALARPDATTGAAADPVPSTTALERDYFRPARARLAELRTARPVSDSDWLDRVARSAADLPPEWGRGVALALPRVEALRNVSGRLGPADGVLGSGDPFPVVPGLDAARPISASALQQLLQCPRMFLMRRVLHWDEPAGAPSLRELDPIPYGSLLHRVVETFYRTHGPDFVAGKWSIGRWQELARTIADREFDAFLSEYPLVGEGIRTKERERLHDSVRVFLEYDWGKSRRYVDVERAFGEPEPLAIVADGLTLHVRGFIDRVDVEGDATIVRDLKSGKAYPRVKPEAGPTAFRDIQLGLYQLAAKRLAGSWETPQKVQAAYAYANGRGDVEERAFRADADALEKATTNWLETAAHVLSARAFSPTPDKHDCEYCFFAPLCGAAASRRAREGLEEEDGDDGPLVRFRKLKLGEGDKG